MSIYAGILLFFALEYLRPGSYVPALNILHLNLLVPAWVVAASLMGNTGAKNSDVLKEANTKIILGLLGLVMIGCVIGEVTMYAFNVFQNVAGYVAIYWVLSKQLDDVDQIKGIFKVLIVVHIIVAAMTPEMFLDSSSRTYIVRAGSFLGDGNDFGLSVLLAVIFCLFLLFEAKNVAGRLLYALGVLALIAMIVATQSRGDSLALGAVAIYYWFKNDRKIIGVALAGLAVVAVVALAPPTYFERLNKIQNYEDDGSAQGRISAWKAGTAMALANPIFGVTAGHFPANYTRYATDGATRWKTAHSIYFLTLGELGFPGLFLLIGLIVSNLVGNWRVAREIWARAPGGRSSTEIRLLATMSAGMLAFAIGGAFLSATYYPHMYVLSGLTVATRRIVRQRLAVTAETKNAAPAVPELTLHWAMRGTIDPRRPHHA